MGWLSLAAGLLKLVNLVMGYIDKNQLLQAGAAENAVRAMETIHAEAEKARESIALIRTDPRWAERLRSLADRDR